MGTALLKRYLDYLLKVFVCAAVVTGFFSTGAVAQAQHEFFKLSKSKDLSGGSVTSITKDSDGFIWIAKKSGLSRYDGSTFKVYAENGCCRAVVCSTNRLPCRIFCAQGVEWGAQNCP